MCDMIAYLFDVLKTTEERCGKNYLLNDENRQLIPYCLNRQSTRCVVQSFLEDYLCQGRLCAGV